MQLIHLLCTSESACGGPGAKDTKLEWGQPASAVSLNAKLQKPLRGPCKIPTTTFQQPNQKMCFRLMQPSVVSKGTMLSTPAPRPKGNNSKLTTCITLYDGDLWCVLVVQPAGKCRHHGVALLEHWSQMLHNPRTVRHAAHTCLACPLKGETSGVLMYRCKFHLGRISYQSKTICSAQALEKELAEVNLQSMLRSKCSQTWEHELARRLLQVGWRVNPDCK